MKNFYFLLFFIFTTHLSAQNFGGAILFHTSEVDQKYDEILIEAIKNAYDKSESIHTEYYTWDGNSGSAPESYNAFNDDSKGSVPIKTALYLQTNFELKEDLKLHYEKDTSGLVKAVYAYYPMQISPYYKIVDVSTSEVVLSHKYDPTKFSGNIKYRIRNFSKYFGEKPDRLKKTAFTKAMNAFKKAELDDVEKLYTKTIIKYGKIIASFSNKLKALQDKKLYKAIEFKMNKRGKLSEFYIDAKKSDYFSKNDVLTMYQKTTVSGYEVYDQVAALSMVSVKDIEGEYIKVKPVLLGRKKMSNAVKSGNDIVFARNATLVKEANRQDDQVKRVQIKSDCFICNQYLETLIVGLSTTKLVERNFEGPRKYFTDQYTNEKFIDYDMASLQGKQEGIDYIFEVTSDGMQATEVATGRIASVNQEKAKGIMKLVGNKGPQTLNLCMDIFDENLDILNVTDEKRGKVKKFMAYNSFGFDNVYSYNMYVIEEETVGGRILEREEHIGKCRLKDLKSSNVAEMKVSKGEKDLANAIAANKKIKFKVKY